MMTNIPDIVHGIDISGIKRCIELHQEEYPAGTMLATDAEESLYALVKILVADGKEDTRDGYYTHKTGVNA